MAELLRLLMFSARFLVLTKGVLTMANDSRTPESAEARIKKKALQAVEGQKAMVEYETGLRQMREKTERLRALRLARDEAEAKLAAEAPPAPKKKAAKKKAAKVSKAEEADDAEAAEAESEAVS
jgi:hypothetical protein